ncbi:hypothetical protein RHSIM_Rhsim11G0138300 [Rhododendron simsii]|uniref:ABC transporter domain-containing protein n=1 Tax=Rhododendron simsii TaxID=118357 RepID=A0A834G8F5_RHOSS|nr:hypothetical protein RHSIM_Rhsim11G0138300 [Rhododendron simsii]
MKSLREKCSLADCSRMIASVDVDGCVNFEEFKKMMKTETYRPRPYGLCATRGCNGPFRLWQDYPTRRLNREIGANTRHTGDILINGRKQALAYGTSAYVTQDEALISTLTVIEAVYYSAQFQLPNSISKSEKKERAEITIRKMGLHDCMNTRIGGWGTKGLSGGQRRRVSICIEILTRPKLLFLDESTSGLDSAASYYVMSRITQLEQRKGRTIIAAIHQPSSEVFELFDNLCLLSLGRVVYFGPASTTNEVRAKEIPCIHPGIVFIKKVCVATDSFIRDYDSLEFFTSNGFIYPTLRNPSDQFLRMINTDFDEDIEHGSTGKVAKEEVINILVTSYNSSQRFQRQVSDICAAER